MSDKESTSNFDRRLLYGAAGFGTVLIGVLVLRVTSGGGDEVAVGVVPRATTPPASTTTTTTSSVDVAAALTSSLDPFNQIVNAPAVSQSQTAQPGQVTQATQAKAVPQATSTSTTKATTTTTLTTTTAPTSTTAAQAASAALNPAVHTTIPTGMSVMTGPVAVPGVPLNICVENGTRGCTAVMPAVVTSVSLLTSATLDPAAPRPPTIVLGACSNGHGVASVITSGSNGTVISGIVFATVNGSQSTFPVSVGATGPDQTVIISACASPGVGVPVPQSGTQSTLGVLLDTVSTSAVGLLGVLSASSGLLPANT